MKKRKPEVIFGTPPTPENPRPSNQVVETRSDGRTIIRTPKPTDKVIREYEQAIRDNPNDAGLQLHFAIALQAIDNIPDALEQAREAARLRPDWDYAQSTLAFALREIGNLDGAIAHLREAIRLKGSISQEDGDQGEAVLRWGLATALRDAGEVAEARKEMETAVGLQREVLQKGVGSSQLLRQLEEELTSYG